LYIHEDDGSAVAGTFGIDDSTFLTAVALVEPNVATCAGWRSTETGDSDVIVGAYRFAD
jgi:hypothetical protein